MLWQQEKHKMFNGCRPECNSNTTRNWNNVFKARKVRLFTSYYTGTARRYSLLRRYKTATAIIGYGWVIINMLLVRYKLRWGNSLSLMTLMEETVPPIVLRFCILLKTTPTKNNTKIQVLKLESDAWGWCSRWIYKIPDWQLNTAFNTYFKQADLDRCSSCNIGGIVNTLLCKVWFCLYWF